MTIKKMVPQPNLETQNFKLRSPSIEDLEMLFQMRIDPENNVFVERTEDKSRSETKKFLEMILEGIRNVKWYYWIVESKTLGNFLGIFCLWNFKEDKSLAEIGFELKTEHRGKGIITEVMPLILEFAEKTLLLSSVQAEVHIDNMASKVHILRNDFQKIASIGHYEIFELKF
ncbi:MAG: GNAT family N-acetyltransferase [Saprospiraceae bacterium]